jgi:acetolactate synthase-1/2/3 large subunit
MTDLTPRHGGLILAEALRLHGTTRVFQVPGESFLAALDGLAQTGAEIVTCRHEGAAAMAAEGTGKELPVV